jgi:Alkylmercury lyase
MSGVTRPLDTTTAWFDHSVVSDPRVSEALGALLSDWRMAKRWDDLPPDHRRLHRAILHGYLQAGEAPGRVELAADFGDATDAILDDLVARDLIVLETGEIVGAYPFTSRLSRHMVEIGGQDIAAMCAIDALGAGAMARRDAQLRADCAECGALIRVAIVAEGLEIARVTPEGMMIWAGVEPVAGCAADTQCRSMLMFCNLDHLEAWRAVHAPRGTGFHLTPAQALELGAAIFRPFLPDLGEVELRA